MTEYHADIHESLKRHHFKWIARGYEVITKVLRRDGQDSPTADFEELTNRLKKHFKKEELVLSDSQQAWIDSVEGDVSIQGIGVRGWRQLWAHVQAAPVVPKTKDTFFRALNKALPISYSTREACPIDGTPTNTFFCTVAS
jgi:hypothetical protein